MNKTKETFTILLNVITYLVSSIVFILSIIYLYNHNLYVTWSMCLVLACLFLCVLISLFLTCAVINNGFYPFIISNIVYAIFSLVFLIGVGFGLNTATVILSVINVLFILTNLSLLSLSKSEQTETPPASEIPFTHVKTQDITREQALKEIEKLKKLKEGGIINEEEFGEKSKKYVDILL